MNQDGDRRADLREEYRQYTIGLALFDIVPVLLFFISGVLIYSMSLSRIFLAGAFAAFLGGMAKVIWKLIVVLAKRDVPALTWAFRVLMIGGFALMLISVPAGGFFGGLWRGLTFMPATLFFIAGIAGMCLMGYLGSRMDISARSNWIEELVNTAAQLAILAGVMIVYFGMSYQPGETAAAALESTDSVKVIEADDYYMFDGPGTEDALVFYQGARVDEAAYAPLMKSLAENGIDCYLCRLKYDFAMLDADAAENIRDCLLAGTDRAGDEAESEAANDAEDVSQPVNYKHWYLGGHSLGGVTAAGLVTLPEDNDDTDGGEGAAESGSGDAVRTADSSNWDGIVLLAAYPTKPMGVPVLLIYGSEDGIVDPDGYGSIGEKGLWPADFTEVRIEGGNHAQFGDYGAQNGDKAAEIPAEEQLRQTAEAIVVWAESR